MSATVTDRTDPQIDTRLYRAARATAVTLAHLLQDRHDIELRPADYEGNGEPTSLVISSGSGFTAHTLGVVKLPDANTAEVRIGADRVVTLRGNYPSPAATAGAAFALLSDAYVAIRRDVAAAEAHEDELAYRG